MEIESKQQILERRKEIEQELVDMLKETGSDFADPIKKLIAAGKQVYLFATAGRISSELNELRENGLKIVDIFDLKEFICWLKESAYKSTKDPVAEAL